MQEKEFKELIEKYLNGDLDEEQNSSVENWLEYITDHHASDRLSIAEKQDAEKNISAKLFERINLPVAVAKAPLTVTLRPVFKIAASLILIMAMGIGFRGKLKEVFDIDQIATVSNHPGKITKSILSDGSIVWLKGKSKLVYPRNFKGKQRNVNLEGEALFEVAKDAARPFIIQCGSLTAQALGTSFNIKKENNSIEVDVLTGRVCLSSQNIAGLTLNRRQKGIYSETRQTLHKLAKPILEVASLTRGTEYDMLFNDARLADVIQRIQNKFEVRISVKKMRSFNTLITADFTDQSLKNTMSMISEALNMQFEIEGQSVEIRHRYTEEAE